MMSRACATWPMVVPLLALLVAGLTGHAHALVGVPAEYDMRVQYDVIFSPHPLSAEAALQVPAHRLYPMRQSNGSAFVCVLPPAEEEVVAAVMDESRARRARGDPEAGLQPGAWVPLEVSTPIHDAIARRGCMEAKKDYWTYVFCAGRFVRQQHQESNTGSPGQVTITDVHYMGLDAREAARRGSRAPGDTATEPAPTWVTRYTFGRDHEGPYLSSLYPLGEKCGITGERRQTEVQLRCREAGGFARLTSMEVEEHHTCAYTVKVYDHELCSHEPLKVGTTGFSIVCHPIPEDEPQMA